MTRTTKQCYECKQQFLKAELIDYCPIGAKTSHSYCTRCLREKQDRELFSEKVCSIFGLKAPGPRIWTERKRLKENYGYTDNIIIDCLDYIYKVKNMRKLSESLFLVNPTTVDDMMKYKRDLQTKSNILLQAATDTHIREHLVSIQENLNTNKSTWNPDDWLEEGI